MTEKKAVEALSNGVSLWMMDHDITSANAIEEGAKKGVLQAIKDGLLKFAPTPVRGTPDGPSSFNEEWITVGNNRIRLHQRQAMPSEDMRRVATLACWAIEGLVDYEFCEEEDIDSAVGKLRVAEVFLDDKHSSLYVITFGVERGWREKGCDTLIHAALGLVESYRGDGQGCDAVIVEVEPGNPAFDSYEPTDHLSRNARNLKGIVTQTDRHGLRPRPSFHAVESQTVETNESEGGILLPNRVALWIVEGQESTSGGGGDRDLYVLTRGECDLPSPSDALDVLSPHAAFYAIDRIECLGAWSPLTGQSKEPEDGELHDQTGYALSPNTAMEIARTIMFEREMESLQRELAVSRLPSTLPVPVKPPSGEAAAEFAALASELANDLPIRQLQRMIRIMRNWKRSEGGK